MGLLFNYKSVYCVFSPNMDSSGYFTKARYQYAINQPRFF